MEQDGSFIINRILSEYCHNKVCVIWWYEKKSAKEFIGTANIVRYNGRFFILTCKHVADAAFNADAIRLVFHNHPIIEKQSLTYLDKTNDDLDTAIIGLPPTEIFTDFFDMSAVSCIPNLGEHTFQDECLHLYGFPGEYSESETGKRKYQGFSFMTNPHQDVLSTVDYLYCEYPSESGEIATSHESKRLPAPFGMSGCFIFLTEGFRDEKHIWAADKSTRIIAIQSATKELSKGKYNYLKGINISHAISMLGKINSKAP